MSSPESKSATMNRQIEDICLEIRKINDEMQKILDQKGRTTLSKEEILEMQSRHRLLVAELNRLENRLF